MRREGEVVALADGGHVVVELSSAVCARCARGRGCGAALFSLPASGPGAPAAPRLNCGVPSGEQGSSPIPSVGDRVGVELDGRDGRWLQAVLLVYAPPTAGLLGGALFPEPWTPFTAIGGTLGGILAWRLPGAGRLLDAVAGPCPTSARIVSVEPRESRCQESRCQES